MASFNNPLLFVQVSAVAFTAIGYRLARADKGGEPVAATIDDLIGNPTPWQA